jgi:hypothetical protein
MEPDSLLTEVIAADTLSHIGKVHLDWVPQPGNYVDVEGKSYAVLERRHRYQYKLGRYRLHGVAIYVKSAERPAEQSFIDGRWAIGDASCIYNARSELIRCAIHPEGPCAGCTHYKAFKLPDI